MLFQRNYSGVFCSRVWRYQRYVELLRFKEATLITAVGLWLSVNKRKRQLNDLPLTDIVFR